MSKIKFRYVYSNGKEIKSFIYTIEEIENCKLDFEYLFDGELYKLEDFKLISRDRFSDIVLKDVELFENDIVEFEVAYNCEYEYKDPSSVYNHKLKTVQIEVKFIEGCFVLESDYIQEDKQMVWLWDNLKIISNTHIENTKEVNWKKHLLFKRKIY